MAMLVMIVLLLANTTYVQVVRGDDYASDSRNSRALYEEYSRERGKIVPEEAAQVQAGVKPSDDTFNSLRTYRNGPMYAPVTGYYSIMYGAGGMENAEDSFLNGSDPRLFVRRLSDM